MSHKREDIKDSTLQTKYNIFEKHIFPTFRNVLISEITDDDIAEWQAKMKNFVMPNGKHFSKSFLRTIQSQFNSIINYANSKGYLNQNPLADIKNMGIKDKRVEFWSTSEYERFAYYAMKYRGMYKVLFVSFISYHKSILSKFRIARCLDNTVNPENRRIPSARMPNCNPICAKPNAFNAASPGM